MFENWWMDVYLSMQLMERRRPTFQINGWMPTYCQQSWWRDAHLPSIKFMKGCLPIPFKLGGGMPTNSCWIDGVMRLMLKHDESILKKKPTSIHLEKPTNHFELFLQRKSIHFELSSEGKETNWIRKEFHWFPRYLKRKPDDLQLFWKGNPSISNWV